MKKLLYTLLAFVTLVNVAKSQSIDIKIADWGIPDVYLRDGKIAYENNNSTNFSASVKFQRYDASTQVLVHAAFVVVNAQGSESQISEEMVVTTSDFTQASGIYWSKEFVKTTWLRSYSSTDVVKLKWRYWDTYSGTTPKWSPYYYASKTYQTINVAVDPGNPPVPGSAPVYSYYNLSVRDHFSTLNPDIVKLFDGWRYDGISFYAYPNSMPGTIPIYDFYNAKDFNHLTTSNRNETDGFPGWEYRGIAFYAYDHQVSGTVPIYMFYNSPDADHFISPDRNATDGFPNWEYRGIVFYAFPK